MFFFIIFVSLQASSSKLKAPSSKLQAPNSKLQAQSSKPQSSKLQAPKHQAHPPPQLLALSGLSYYAYNEVAFLALGAVNPVTHAVGNTIKRVVIIIASVIAFKTPMSRGSIVGSSIAIMGTLAYSLAMNANKAKAKAEVVVVEDVKEE